MEPGAEPGSVNIIVACSENRVIGRNGRLPWRIAEDWNWFMGHTLNGSNIIGRISFEAMLRGGHVNGDRRFHVISTNQALAGPFSKVHGSTSEALAAAREDNLPIWICGGERIYEESLPLAHRLYLTQVHAQVDGDAWMPDWTPFFTREVYRREGSDARWRYTFSVLEPS